MTANTLTIRRPDDWHVHLRDGDILKGVLPYTARQFARAIVMPNLSPPVIRASDGALTAIAFWQRCSGHGFHAVDDRLFDERYRCG